MWYASYIIMTSGVSSIQGLLFHCSNMCACANTFPIDAGIIETYNGESDICYVMWVWSSLFKEESVLRTESSDLQWEVRL